MTRRLPVWLFVLALVRMAAHLHFFRSRLLDWDANMISLDFSIGVGFVDEFFHAPNWLLSFVVVGARQVAA